MLKGKTVLPGMTGSIAAYETTDPASMLVRKGMEVHAPMTESVTHFINPITSEGLTGNKCLVDAFNRNFEFSVKHVALAKQADVVTVAPASANVIGKTAHGVTDDMLTIMVAAHRCKRILVPTMNTNVYENPILQDNLNICRRYSMEVIAPAWGYLAYGGTGAGKISEPEVLYEYILREAGYPGDLAGKRILVTAGLTRESIDPVRHITNYSTDKMGYAIARVTAYRGIDVILASDPTDLDHPLFVETVPVESAREMFGAATARSGEQDITVKAAAVADYRPSMIGTEKIKGSDGDLSIALEQVDDILGWLGQNQRDRQLLCGFFMGTQNTLKNSRAKLARKQIDMIITDSLKVEDAGSGTNTDVVTPITRESGAELLIMSKGEVVGCLLTEILGRTKGQGGLNPV